MAIDNIIRRAKEIGMEKKGMDKLVFAYDLEDVETKDINSTGIRKRLHSLGDQVLRTVWLIERSKITELQQIIADYLMDEYYIIAPSIKELMTEVPNTFEDPL